MFYARMLFYVENNDNKIYITKSLFGQTNLKEPPEHTSKNYFSILIYRSLGL